MDFSLKTNTIAPYEHLKGDDLILFYYDISTDVALQNPIMYDWNETMKSFSKEIDIAFCSKDEMPDFVVENQVRLTKCSFDQGSNAMAFFRHLRNAFAHYQVRREGEWFIIKDWNPNDKKQKYTFIGKIKTETFRNICFSFFEQREKIFNK